MPPDRRVEGATGRALSTVCNNLGVAAHRLKKPDAAEKALSAAFERDSDSRSALFNRGLTYGRLGNKTKAFTDYRAVLRIDAGRAAARRSLRRLGARS